MSVSIDCMHGMHDVCRYTECKCDCHDADDVSGRLKRAVLHNAAILERSVESYFAEPPATELPLSEDCDNDHHVTCTYGEDGCMCACHAGVEFYEPNIVRGME